MEKKGNGLQHWHATKNRKLFETIHVIIPHTIQKLGGSVCWLCAVFKKAFLFWQSSSDSSPFFYLFLFRINSVFLDDKNIRRRIQKKIERDYLW